MTSDIFDYYYDEIGLCQPIAETICIENPQYPCLRDPDGTGSLPALQIFESKSGATICTTPLTQRTP